MRRLLIIADHSLIVHSIRLALKQTVGFDVVGYADGRAPVQDALIRNRPDVVLVDDMRSIDTALPRLREAAEHAPRSHRLLLTLSMDEDRLAGAFEAGAHAVLSKSMHPVSLGTMLREVVRGNVVHRFERRPPAVEECPLSGRELEVLRLAAAGHTNGQIGRLLWVTEQTVKFHLSNTYRKLGVSNRTEASHYAHRNDLLGEPVALAS
jgi:DNA-binding NarL/FixJ family response regulator